MTAEHAHGIDTGGEVEALAVALCHEYHPMHWDVAYGNRGKPCWACRSHAARLGSDWLTRQTAADTVLATARRLCCGDNPASHHAATDAHSQRMAFAEELARAVRW